MEDGQETQYEEELYKQKIVALLQGIFHELRTSYPLLIAIFSLFVLYWILVFCLVQPTYTAQAVIGPPNPSPVNSLLASGGSSSGISGIARKLSGGGGGGSDNDPFLEYQQLLQSTRLAAELSERDDFLHLIFANQWDSRTGNWKPRSALHGIASSVYRVLNRPITDNPDVFQLKQFLDTHLSSAPSSNGKAFSLVTPDSSYILVSFSYPGRYEAERYLAAILRRTDEIIRREQMRDVTARIDYIQGELPKVSGAEQKQALIETLTGQEELQTMMVADKLFASTLVSTPFASPIPTYPPSLGRAIAVSILGALAVWISLVALGTRSLFFRNCIRFFRTSKTS